MAAIRSNIGAVISACDRLGQALPSGAFLLSWWLELALAAGLFALLLVSLSRITRLGGKIRAVRRKMVAATEEILLYRRRPLTVIRAELKLVSWNAVLLLVLAPLLAVGGSLFKAAYGSLDNRYGFAPCRVGEDVIVRAGISQGPPAETVPDGLACSMPMTAMVRSPATGQVSMRLRPTEAGLFPLTLPNGTKLVLNVGCPARPAMPRQRAGDVEVRIGYPPRKLLGMRRGWVPAFFGWSMVLAWPLSRWIAAAT